MNRRHFLALGVLALALLLSWELWPLAGPLRSTWTAGGPPASASAAAAKLPTSPDVTSWPAAFQQRLATATAALAEAPGSGSSPSPLAELGRLYHANGFNPEAEACWQRLAAQQPREPRWRYYLADLRRAESDHDGLLAELDAVLTLAPDYAPAYLHRGNLQLKSGAFDAAERDFRRCLGLAPRDPYARLGLVRLALHHGRTADARGGLEELLRDTPHFSTAHNLYAELLAAAGETEPANWHRWLGVETLRYREPPDPWLDELQAWCYDYDRLCVLGSTEALRAEHDRARAFYERAIALRPEAPEAYHLLGETYLARQEPARARTVLEEARARVAPGRGLSLLPPLCRAYRLLQQSAQSERVAREGLAAYGESAELHEALALALADQERHPAALAAYDAALRLNPNDASINYNRAVTLLSLNRLDDALASLDRSLTLQPGFVPTLLLRGEIELAAGHAATAEKHFRRVLAAHPENELAQRLLAKVPVTADRNR